MPVSLPSSAQDRLLVVAPHPDDETIATGGLIHSALLAGADVNVLFATDGDNNPWPQRWLERRWRIGRTERARWGARRRAEARLALDRLGGGGRVADAHFLGWPDQGLTSMLMHDESAIDVLSERIEALAPSHVAMPALDDCHPDHSALRVMLELALLRADIRCVRLGYRVHGAPSPYALRLAADASQKACKRAAMEAYASQLALSRRRLVAMAERAEAFEADNVAPTVEGNPAAVAIRCDCPRMRALPRELLLLLATRNGVLRFRHVLPWTAAATRLALRDEHGRTLEAEWRPGMLLLDLPPFARPLLGAWAKCDRGHPRVVVYDREYWNAAPRTATAAVDAAPATIGH